MPVYVVVVVPVLMAVNSLAPVGLHGPIGQHRRRALDIGAVECGVAVAEGRKEGEHPDDEDGHRDQQLDESEAALSLRSALGQLQHQELPPYGLPSVYGGGGVPSEPAWTTGKLGKLPSSCCPTTSGPGLTRGP